MKRKFCLALGAAMLAGTITGCSGGTSGLPGDTTAAQKTLCGHDNSGFEYDRPDIGCNRGLSGRV